MSGECDECGEHCLECSCKQKRHPSIPPKGKRMKLKIVWCNGDVETIEVPEQTVANIQSGKVVAEWDQWRFLLKGATGGINMKYARRFYLEEE